MILTAAELAYAGEVAARIVREGRARGWKHHFPNAHPERTHLLGACGEIAAARVLDLPPVLQFGVSALSAPDLPHDIQVRTVPFRHYGLIVHERDRDHWRFVLVVGSGAEYEVAGWLNGYEARKPRYWRANLPHPAYWVPQRDLRPIEDLRQLIAEEGNHALEYTGRRQPPQQGGRQEPEEAQALEEGRERGA